MISPSASTSRRIEAAGRRVRLVIDRPVLDRPEIGFHPCLNTSTLAVSTGDLTGAIIPALRHRPTVVELPNELTIDS